DLADSDVAPAARRRVNDLDERLFAFEDADVERLQRHVIVVAAGHGERRLAAYVQVHTGPAFMRAAADPEPEEIPLEGEPPAGELAGLRVSTGDVMGGCGGVGVDDPLAFAAQVALVA